MIVEPSAEARQAAQVFFQQFRAFLDAGFTEEQSLKLISYMLNASQKAEE